jgi:hypothetical protein
MSCIERMIRVISLFITVAMSAAGHERRIRANAPAAGRPQTAAPPAARVASGSGHNRPPAPFRDTGDRGSFLSESSQPGVPKPGDLSGSVGAIGGRVNLQAAVRTGRPAKAVRFELEGVMNFTKFIGFLLLATSLSFSALAQSLPKVGKPDEVGFSAQRLKRLSDAFQSDVDINQSINIPTFFS